MDKQFNLEKLYPGCVVGINSVINPINEIIELTTDHRFGDHRIAEHIQIAYRDGEINKLAEMVIPRIRGVDASQDKNGIFGTFGNHICFVASWIAPNDYDTQDKANTLIKSYVKAGYKYDTLELLDFWGAKFAQEENGFICSKLYQKYCLDMGFTVCKDQNYSPHTVQLEHQTAKNMIYTCYKGEV